MKSKFLDYNDHYELIQLTEDYLQELFRWMMEEKHFELYTCRPVNLPQSFDEYAQKTLNSTSEEKQKTYILIKKGAEKQPLGKITLFDFNTRNHSAEFGYYLPTHNRKKGLGNILLALFIEKAFSDNKLSLNKIYATTSSNNIPSIKLLEKFDFKLDGRLREHYWVNENKYDQLNYSMLKDEWRKIV
ncbi:GNAT family N-acetyltransferase [Clostridium bowmanii]|uniref:GNAT family N-acetyltransferase n=1 Tax=Clostridium bowmanii TaxID=132925 RepID=UPI001C0B00D4|nr:GNAT family protein [Clostridium bowmanii]MBU3191841.1 GNAT family N-acetyltransferase [Clostridium bowmanii]MCA1076169.1 GNAT family N-acetyltransferase [Clostridium bowmanii]